MNKAKPQTLNIFQIIFKGIAIYIRHFIPLSRAMLFPVFGQIIGIAAVLYPAFIVFQTNHKLIETHATSANILLSFIILIISVLPGFFIFTRSFTEFLIVMASSNAMVASIVKNGNIKDFKQFNQAIKQRGGQYFALIMYFALIWLAGFMVPFGVFFLSGKINGALLTLAFALLELLAFLVLIIVSVYLSLGYQVFAFEEISALKVIKRSWNLVEGNFWRTFILGGIVMFLTSLIIPLLFQMGIEKTGVANYLSYPLNMYFAITMADPGSLSELSAILKPLHLSSVFSDYTVLDFSKKMTMSLLNMIVSEFVLPVASACYTLLYLDILARKK